MRWVEQRVSLALHEHEQSALAPRYPLSTLTQDGGERLSAVYRVPAIATDPSEEPEPLAGLLWRERLNPCLVAQFQSPCTSAIVYLAERRARNPFKRVVLYFECDKFRVMDKPKNKGGRPPKYGPDGPLKRHKRRELASAVNKDGSLRKKHVSFTPAKQREYFELLAENGLKAHACRVLNISREALRLERQKNPAFAELEAEALDYFNETLEQEAIRRAKDGVDKPIYYKGHKVDTVKEFSDRLMEVLLTGRIPEKYGKQLKGDTNVSVSGVLVINQRVSAEDWEQAAQTKALPSPEDVVEGEYTPVEKLDGRTDS